MKETTTSGVTRETNRLEPWMNQTITFPPIRTKDSKEGPIIITATITGQVVPRIHIAEGSHTNIMYQHCFMHLDEPVRNNLTDDPTTLSGSFGQVVRPIGQIRLPVIIGEGGRFRSLEMTFSVVRASVPANVIIGRSGIRALRAVASTVHGAIKFPTPNGIATMLSEEEHAVEQVSETGTSGDDEEIDKGIPVDEKWAFELEPMFRIY